MDRKRIILWGILGLIVIVGGLFALSVQQGWIKMKAEEEEETGVTEEKSGACYLIKKDSDPKCFEFCEDMDEDKCDVQDAIFLEGKNCTADPKYGIVLGMYPLCADIGCCVKSYWWNSAPRDQAPRLMNAVSGTKNVTKQICAQYDEGGPRTTYYNDHYPFKTYSLPPGPPPGWIGDWHPEKMAAWLVENEECSSHLICNQKNMCILKEFPGDTDERCEDKKDGETCKEESSEESPADEPAEESPDEE